MKSILIPFLYHQHRMENIHIYCIFLLSDFWKRMNFLYRQSEIFHRKNDQVFRKNQYLRWAHSRYKVVRCKFAEHFENLEKNPNILWFTY